jgi:cytochrome c oxidase cbb3-type subunit IV
MDKYSLLREFADSWALLALVVFFVGVVLFAFRPGSRKMHDDIAMIPLRNDGRPLEAHQEPAAKKTTSTGTNELPEGQA